jgi:hypothetical protein
MGGTLEQAIARSGGILHATELPLFLYHFWKQSDIDNIQTVKYDFYDKRRRINLHIGKSDRINAVALTDLDEPPENQDHIIVNIGVPAVYKTVMDGIFADGRNFDEVGSIEPLNDPFKWQSLSDLKLIIKQPRIQSKCPVRCYLSSLIARLVFQYTAHHEQGHIIRGHTEFIKNGGMTTNAEIDESLGNAPGYDVASACQLIVGKEEASRSKQPNRRALVWQSLERDADLWAVTRTLWVNPRIGESILKERDNVAPALLAARTEMFGSPEKILFYVAYALYISHRVFNPRHWDMYKQVIVDPEYNNRHPHTLFRLESIYDILVNNIQYTNLYPELRHLPFSEILLHAFAHADRACHWLTQSDQRPTSFDIFAESGTEGFAIYRKMLIETFETLVPKLGPFVKGGVFPGVE